MATPAKRPITAQMVGIINLSPIYDADQRERRFGRGRPLWAPADTEWVTGPADCRWTAARLEHHRPRVGRVGSLRVGDRPTAGRSRGRSELRWRLGWEP